MSVPPSGDGQAPISTSRGVMLRIERLNCAYGPVTAVRDVNLEAGAGEVVCILGANGAGKTTLLSAIAGAVRPKSGRIMLDDEDVTGARPESMVKRGVVLVPEGRQVFASMSVRDNLLLGGYSRRRDRGQVAGALEEVHALFPVLQQNASRAAGTLSGGEQQMLAIGRALMARPRLLMLDEPSLGLAPMVVERLMAVIAGLAGESRGVLIVEQLARVALTVSHRGYLLESGRATLSGTSAELQGDDRVRQIYMGIRR